MEETTPETGGLFDYGSMFTPVASEVTDGISAIVPIALPIFGIVLAIGIGIKVFARLAKKG